MIDNLNQGGVQLPLPDDLQARIENAQNNITIMEAEYKRLAKLSQDLTNDINTKHVEVTELEDNLELMMKNEQSLERSVTDLIFQKDELAKAISDDKQILQDTNERLDTISAEIAKKQSELDKREAGVSFKEESLRQRDEELTKQVLAHQVKVERIKQAIQ